MPETRKQPETIMCRNCGAPNPRNAYCCLQCFKVLRPKTNVPWYRVQIKPSMPVSIALIGASLFGIYLVKRWMDSIEAQVTMNFKSDEYNVSLVADKHRKHTLFDVKNNMQADDPSASDQKNPSEQ